MSFYQVIFWCMEFAVEGRHVVVFALNCRPVFLPHKFLNPCVDKWHHPLPEFCIFNRHVTGLTLSVTWLNSRLLLQSLIPPHLLPVSSLKVFNYVALEIHGTECWSQIEPWFIIWLSSTFPQPSLPAMDRYLAIWPRKVMQFWIFKPTEVIEVWKKWQKARKGLERYWKDCKLFLQLYCLFTTIVRLFSDPILVGFLELLVTKWLCEGHKTVLEKSWNFDFHG